MKINRINDHISVSPQIAPADVAELARAGFQTIINNRPDHESPDQPTRAAVRAAAEQAGLNFVDIPFAGGAQTAADIQAFAEAVAGQPGPILAYCRTGTRSATIWAMSQAGKMPADDIITAAAGAGYDLAPMRPMLEASGPR